MTKVMHEIGGFTSLTTFGGESDELEVWASADDAVAYAREFDDPARAQRSFNAACRCFINFPPDGEGGPFYRPAAATGQPAYLNLAAIPPLLGDSRLFELKVGFGKDCQDFIRGWCEYALDEVARLKGWFPLSLEQFLELCRKNQALEVTLEHALESGWEEFEAKRFFARRLAAVKLAPLEYLLPYLERYHIRWNEVMNMVCLAMQQADQIHPSYNWREHVLRRPEGPVVPLNLYGPW